MYNGVLNIYKEKNFTSHDVVAKLRGILKQKKIGHTGTLDPNACGVLPVCLGKATRLCDLLTNKDKIYDTILLLGTQTDTQDIYGKVLNKTELDIIKKINPKDIEEVIYSFVGNYSQIPPMYSAIKINGKRCYELARAGIEVERTPRRVDIISIEIVSMELPRINLRVQCSKGTYIRTLCHDIGMKLGCGACMEELLRTKVERFTLENSISLSTVEMLVNTNKINDVIIPIDEMFSQYPKVIVLEEYNKLLYNGNALTIECIGAFEEEYLNTNIRVYDENNTFVALYKYDENNHILKNVKMFL